MQPRRNMSASYCYDQIYNLSPQPPRQNFRITIKNSAVQHEDRSKDRTTPVRMDLATTPSPIPPPAYRGPQSEYNRLFREVEAAARRRPQEGETWEEVRENTQMAWTRLLAFESNKKELDYLDKAAEAAVDKLCPNWKEPGYKPPVRTRSSSREPRKDEPPIPKGEFRRHSELSRVVRKPRSDAHRFDLSIYCQHRARDPYPKPSKRGRSRSRPRNRNRRQKLAEQNYESTFGYNAGYF
ncbi:hypothetical protein GCK72_023078 [Caenorhabditis remanei]|uniref:Uncharacterized protein n=1 Tax=Caenorhabditis remanei TaxID=31234 RepID=A0A6A5FW03_CAERE|nr:hypothetical protein GCK72_023078 [Caenorhabditis remanei]KAF1746621.1 hypothetical protein GCK72_023078 [Caenorhabditis remanei]